MGFRCPEMKKASGLGWLSFLWTSGTRLGMDSN